MIENHELKNRRFYFLLIIKEKKMADDNINYTVEQLEELYEDALKELDDLKLSFDSLKDRHSKLQMKYQIQKDKNDQLISERDELINKCEYHQNLATNARDEQMKLIDKHLVMISQIGEMIKTGPAVPPRVSSTTRSKIRQQIISKSKSKSESSDSSCKVDNFDWDSIRPQN